jgi:hypothetical protein
MENKKSTFWQCKKCLLRNPKTKRCHKDPPMPVYNPATINNIVYVHPLVDDDDCCLYFGEHFDSKSKLVPNLKKWCPET